MNWSRLGRAVWVALLVSFVVGAVLSPPDPFTQLLYAGPLFVVALPVIYRYGPRIWG
jgi:Sec-independent protein secretion pathway component TatC